MSNPNHLSYSQIELAKCPMKFQLCKIDKKYDIKTLPLTVGLFKHELSAVYVKYCVQKQIEGDFSELEKVFSTLWEKYKIPEDYYDEIRGEVLTFGERDVNFQNVLDVEYPFRVEFAPGKFVDGIMDITRVYKPRGNGEPALHLFDYKNQANILKQLDTLTIQLKIYTLAATLIYPNFEFFRRGIYYLRYNFIRCFEDEENPTHINEIKVEVEQTKEMLLREWKKIKESKDFPCIPGDWCYQYGGCPVLRDGKCPAYKGIKIDSDIENIMRKILEMNTLIKDYKARAKDYVKHNGNITIDGKEYGYIEDDKNLYNLKKVLAIVDKFDIDIDVYDMSKTTVNKIEKIAGSKIFADDFNEALSKVKRVEKGTKLKLT